MKKFFYKAFAVHPKTLGLHSFYHGNSFVCLDEGEKTRPAYVIGKENLKDKKTEGFYAFVNEESALVWAEVHIRVQADFVVRRVKLAGRIEKLGDHYHYGEAVRASKMTIVRKRKKC